VTAPEGPSTAADSPIGTDTWSERAGYDHRASGRGGPLAGTSWLNRPFYAGALLGILYGEPLIEAVVGQHEGALGGVRLGWDYDYYWGCETRLAFADMELANASGADLHRSGDVTLWDVDLLYYPWGDAVWRPYAMVGAGLAGFAFDDGQGRHYDELAFAMPIGFGIKHGCSPSTLLRLEAVDNIAFGNGTLEAMHNWSLTVGIEWRFGGRRPSYWPWNPSRYLP
jgi:hypothetical protein